MASLFRKTSSPFSGGDSIWLSSSNAGVVASAEFFGEATPTTVLGYIKYWTGTAWAFKAVKYWTGSAWVQKPLKYWNGSAWTLTSYSV